MKKLASYPSQAISYVDKGKFMVMLTTDIEKVISALVYFGTFPVRIMTYYNILAQNHSC